VDDVMGTVEEVVVVVDDDDVMDVSEEGVDREAGFAVRHGASVAAPRSSARAGAAVAGLAAARPSGLAATAARADGHGDTASSEPAREPWAARGRHEGSTRP
jgi:hypothetical protein